MKMKDDRFGTINQTMDLDTASVPEPNSKPSIIDRMSNWLDMFKAEVNAFAEKNKEKFERNNCFQNCQFCNRDKFFPCLDESHMKLHEGLCPDRVCGEVLQERTKEELDLETYPEYRA